MYRSDTDSGRSSAPGDACSDNVTEPTAVTNLSKQPIYATSLKVIRRNAAAVLHAAQASPPVTIAGCNKEGEKPQTNLTQGHVRKRKDEILRKKQQTVRRNTVAVNSIDVDRSIMDEVGGYETVGIARSNNCLNRLAVPALPHLKQLDANGVSMPGKHSNVIMFTNVIIFFSQISIILNSQPFQICEFVVVNE